jgi:transposase
MGAPYSQDLRLRVLAALDGGMSKMKAHQTFLVARSTIDDWLQLRAHTGGVAVLPPVRRGPLPAIQDLGVFEEFATRHCYKTLAGMQDAWEQERGQRLSDNTFSLALRRIGWTRKKSAGSTVSVWGPAQP